MNRPIRHRLATVLCAAVIGLASSQTASASIMSLALAIDGSGSIGSTDFDLQIDNYESIFATNFYDTYVDPSPYDTLVVSAFVFSTNVVQSVGWTAINDNDDATAFSALVGAITYPAGWTNTEGVILDATMSILNNGYDSDKMVIDISTDGVPTICDGGTSSSNANNGCDTAGGETPISAAIAAANAARDSGIFVNAIGIGDSISEDFLEELVGLDPLDTPTGFYVLAPSYEQFGAALASKLGREITEVPEPAPLLLLASGLLLLAIRRGNMRTFRA